MKMYYEEFPLEGGPFLIKFKERMEKAMDQVRKDHYFTFCKHLPIYDHALHMDSSRKSKFITT